MNDFTRMVNHLRTGGYTFMYHIDESLHTRDIIVKTTDDDLTLNYRFDTGGRFERMWYCICHYEMLLDTMLECNLLTGQFDDFHSYNGGKLAKVRETE